MHKLGLRAFLFVFMAGFLSCGDPRMDEHYQGAPLLKYRGQVAYSDIFPDAKYDIRLSVFWCPAGIESDVGFWREQTSTSISIQFPSTFVIELYQPPNDFHFMTELPDLAMGRILLYDDKNQDGRFSKHDSFVGGADSKAIIYVKNPLALSESPLGLGLEKGFYLINIPMNCNKSAHVQPHPGEAPGSAICASLLGHACTKETQEQDCKGGECLPDDGSIFGMPGGYCTLKVQENSCPPTFGNIMLWTHAGEKDAYYFKSCDSNLSCRGDEGYICQSPQKVCIPDTPVFLLLEPDYIPAEFCRNNKTF